MTASRTPSEPTSLVSPVIDYEPPPIGATACPPPTPAALRRRTARPLRLISHAAVREPAPPQAAVVFADTALRRVLEVIDRRRPVAQLRPLLAPALIDTVIGMTRSQHSAAATLRRVRLRLVDGNDAAEVFATYTRGPRVRAIAARVALNGDRWRIVAL
ncbi:MAG TPA: Rv3235 family protein, partial [Mycobacterium sp.]|nr:Rv3235 family protein [Mycobacterium sp.]